MEQEREREFLYSPQDEESPCHTSRAKDDLLPRYRECQEKSTGPSHLLLEHLQSTPILAALPIGFPAASHCIGYDNIQIMQAYAHVPRCTDLCESAFVF